GLVETMADTATVVPYYDLSFQHAAPKVLRRMRRFGDPEAFLGLLGRIRSRTPHAGIRSNVIVGFPGETEADVDLLAGFLEQARLDAVGVFAYSDEEGTEAYGLPDHVAPEVVAERMDRIVTLTQNLMEQRADERIGERVRVLVESVEDGVATGRAAHQGPDVDPVCHIEDPGPEVQVGGFIWGRVTATDGVDLIVKEEGPHGR
ncbi:MAG: MiaB/RimO family radical SAM methylthiotransferase, partial [Propioniciclava sp.]